MGVPVAVCENGKSVMAWFHGGSFGWGGIIDPLYSGKGYPEGTYPGQPWMKACHACELTYVFNNLEYDLQTRKTFMVGRDGSVSVEEYPFRERTELLRELAYKAFLRR